MQTILLTNHYVDELYEMLVRAVDGRFNLRMLDKLSREDLIRQASMADYILSSGPLEIDEAVLLNAHNLKMIQRTGVGVDRIDLEALRKRKIPLYVNPGVNARSVAEWTLMLILASLKRSHISDKEMKSGKWDKQYNGIKNHELAGKTVGIVGMGNIGRAVAEMLRGFNVNIIYFSRHLLSESEERKLQAAYVDFPELLTKSDIVTLHCPYDKTVGCIIGEAEFCQMKEGAILINTARGKLVDEAALLKALETRKLSACGIDVFENEPVSGKSALADFDNAILSPHIAGLSKEGYERMLAKAIENIWMYDCGDEDKIEPYLYE